MSRITVYYFRYFPATLKAKEGNIKNTLVNKSRINISVVGESGVSGPEAVRIIRMPMIPKRIDEPMKIRVAIFCMILVYHRCYA